MSKTIIEIMSESEEEVSSRAPLMTQTYEPFPNNVVMTENYLENPTKEPTEEFENSEEDPEEEFEESPMSLPTLETITKLPNIEPTTVNPTIIPPPTTKPTRTLPIPSGEGPSRISPYFLMPRFPLHHPQPPASPQPAPRRHDKRTWEWVTPRIDKWQEFEGLKGIPELDMALGPTIVPAITGEPIHHTVATLVARQARTEDHIGLHREHDRRTRQQLRNWGVEMIETATQVEFAHDRADQFDKDLDLIRARLLSSSKRENELKTRLEHAENHNSHLEAELALARDKIGEHDRMFEELAKVFSSFRASP